MRSVPQAQVRRGTTDQAASSQLSGHTSIGTTELRLRECRSASCKSVPRPFLLIVEKEKQLSEGRLFWQRLHLLT